MGDVGKTLCPVSTRVIELRNKGGRGLCPEVTPARPVAELPWRRGDGRSRGSVSPFLLSSWELFLVELRVGGTLKGLR